MKTGSADLQFPADAPKLLLVDIVERTCRASVIHEVTNIGRCMKVYNDKGDFEVSQSVRGLGRPLTGSESLSQKDPT